LREWRLISSGYMDGAMNMAIDEALLHAVAAGESPPVLRFYRWRPATVSLGYAQSVHTDLDLELCKAAGLGVVRRATGGRAVLHDNELTYAIIAPLATAAFGHSVLDCYRGISEILQKTLQQLGLPAQLVPGKPKGGQRNAMRAVCFSAPSQYELVVEGRKVAGSAQKRCADAFLQHGSIPVEIDLELLGRVLRVATDNPRAGSLESVGWLNRWLDPAVSVARVEEVFTEVFAQHQQLAWQRSQLTAAEDKAAQRWYREQFSAADWTMKR
jgi:lipoate-protein ligase A